MFVTLSSQFSELIKSRVHVNEKHCFPFVTRIRMYELNQGLNHIEVLKNMNVHE